jgi:hypothetical protein
VLLAPVYGWFTEGHDTREGGEGVAGGIKSRMVKNIGCSETGNPDIAGEGWRGHS